MDTVVHRRYQLITAGLIDAELRSAEPLRGSANCFFPFGQVLLRLKRSVT